MILENLVLVVGLILTGTAMRKSGWFPQNTSDVLNTFVLNVSLPAIIMISIPYCGRCSIAKDLQV